jgi:hypothetical protein
MVEAGQSRGVEPPSPLIDEQLFRLAMAFSIWHYIPYVSAGWSLLE